MTLFASLRERLARPAVPPHCFACRQAVMPLEALGGDRFFCPCCSKDFSAVQVGPDTWQVDLTPLRKRRR